MQNVGQQSKRERGRGLSGAVQRRAEHSRRMKEQATGFRGALNDGGAVVGRGGSPGDAVLASQDRRFIQRLRESSKQLGQNPRHESEHTGGRFDYQNVSTRRKHHERDYEADDRDLEHAINSRINRACVGD